MRVGVSNLSLSQRTAMFGGVEAHRQFLNTTRYDGYELMPTRGPFTRQLQQGVGLDLVESLHQGFRTEEFWRSLREANPRGLSMVATLPHTIASLPILERVQTQSDRELPAVLYPSEEFHPAEVRVKGPRTFQPCPEVVRLWGIHDVANMGEALVEEALRRGYDGLTIDTYHWQRELDGARLPPFENVVGALASHGIIKSIHLGINRGNARGKIYDARDVMDGKLGETDGEILLMALGAMGINPYVVVEAPGLPLDNRTTWHKNLVEALRRIQTMRLASLPPLRGHN